MHLSTAFEIYHYIAILAGIIVAFGILGFIFILTLRLGLPVYIKLTQNQFRKDVATDILHTLKAELI
jgi:hypothetical protein